MDTIEKVRDTEFLGRDFLVWLWFKSDTNNGYLDMGEAGEAEVRFNGVIILQSESDEAVETVRCSGTSNLFKEARYALSESKKVTRSSIRLIMGDDEWFFTLDSTWLNFRTLKTPKVVQDDKDDPDGLFYEKAGLIEKAISVVDKLYESFINLRISPEWTAHELPAIREWINSIGSSGLIREKAGTKVN